MRNRYYAMRHGHSVANEQGIIASHPCHGIAGYGLSKIGRKQIQYSIKAVVSLHTQTSIFSSDFKRARETAETVHRNLRCERKVITDSRLRERNFGELELCKDELYPTIWSRDKEDPAHTDHGVESAASVMSRTTELIAELEDAGHDQIYLLVSHGDPLQILQTAFMRWSPSRHREIEPLGTAEIRLLELSGHNR